MTDVVTEGGCLCSAVRYQVHGPPANSMICHCRTCGKAAGSPVVAWVTVPITRFSFVRGTPTEYRSSPPVVRAFCSSCGTPLTYVHAARPAEIDVTTCTLDDPDAFPPSHHSWVSHDPRWLHFHDGLPAHRMTSLDS
jgi:hypothetical protein